MPVMEQHLTLRVANLTAFLRFQVGVVRGHEPQNGDPGNDRGTT
jgi:hypothetical protein